MNETLRDFELMRRIAGDRICLAGSVVLKTVSKWTGSTSYDELRCLESLERNEKMLKCVGDAKRIRRKTGRQQK